MGLFDALANAVSGLQSQAYAMQNISGNIANSQTISYKGLNTNFQDLIPDSNSVASQQVGSGVYASSLATVTVQGAIQAATASSPSKIQPVSRGPRRTSTASSATRGAATSS
jgi:flagellar hook protein FlgE